MGLFKKYMIMKKVIFMFSMFVSVLGNTQNLPDFLSKAEKKFVKNVIDIHGGKPVEITKRKDKHIVVEFNNTMFVLKPDGFVGEMWILEDGDWLSLGQEEDSY
jgi:hypothetical protein